MKSAALMMGDKGRKKDRKTRPSSLESKIVLPASAPNSHQFPSIRAVIKESEFHRLLELEKDNTPRPLFSVSIAV